LINILRKIKLRTMDGLDRILLRQPGDWKPLKRNNPICSRENNNKMNLMFIAPCIIVIVEE